MLDIFWPRRVAKSEYDIVYKWYEEARAECERLRALVAPPASPTGYVTSGGLPVPTYRELYTAAAEEARIARQDADSLLLQFDAERKEHEERVRSLEGDVSVSGDYSKELEKLLQELHRENTAFREQVQELQAALELARLPKHKAPQKVDLLPTPTE
jgi:hypothetical protein